MAWFRRAADQGHAVAQCALGFHYAFGDGAPQDCGEAATWFGKAANQGCEYAQNKDPTQTHQQLEIVRDVLTLVGSLFARNVTAPKKSNSPHNQITCAPVQWGHAWEQFHTLTPQELDLLRPALASMRAFYCWIDDHDHDWSDGNALLERTSAGEIRAAFIDHSYSLTKAWNPPAPPLVRNWRTMNGPYAQSDIAAMTRIVEQIEQFPLTDLPDIIQKVPPDCLSAAGGDALAHALFDRREQLRGLLNLTGAS